MANLIGKAAGGKWTAATTWEEEGTKTEKVPTTSDVCIIKGGESGEIKVDAASKCRSLETTGKAKLNVSKALAIGKSAETSFLKLGKETELTVTGVGKFEFATGSTQEIDAQGVDLGVVLLSAGATTKYKLVSKLLASTELNAKAGILLTEGQEMSLGKWFSEGGTLKEFVLGTSLIKISGAVEFAAGEGALTVKPGTSTIEFTGTAKTLKAGNQAGKVTLNIVTFTGAEAAINEGPKIAALNLLLSGAEASRIATFQSSTLTEVEALTKSSGSMTIKASVEGTIFRIANSSGEVSLENVKLRDSEAEGGATFRDINGEKLGSNNAGWIFETRVPIVASAGSSSATLALAAPTQIATEPSSGSSAATLALNAPTFVAVEESSAKATATLTVETNGNVDLSAAASTSSATLTVGTTASLTLTSTGQSGASATVTTTAPLELAGSATASATLNVTAAQPITLQVAKAKSDAENTVTTVGGISGTSAGQSAAALTVTTSGNLGSLTASATSSAGVLAITPPIFIELDAASSESMAGSPALLPSSELFPENELFPSGLGDLQILINVSLPLAPAQAISSAPPLLLEPYVAINPASAKSGASLSLSAPIEVPLEPSGPSTASGSLIVSVTPELPLDVCSATSEASFRITTSANLPLQEVTSAESSASLSINTTGELALNASVGQSTATLALTDWLVLGPAVGTSSATAQIAIPQPLALTAIGNSSATLAHIGLGFEIPTDPASSEASGSIEIYAVEIPESSGVVAPKRLSGISSS